MSLPELLGLISQLLSTAVVLFEATLSLFEAAVEFCKAPANVGEGRVG